MASPLGRHVRFLPRRTRCSTWTSPLEKLGADEGPSGAAGKAAIEALHERIRGALDDRASAGFPAPPGAQAWIDGPELHGSRPG